LLGKVGQRYRQFKSDSDRLAQKIRVVAVLEIGASRKAAAAPISPPAPGRLSMMNCLRQAKHTTAEYSGTILRWPPTPEIITIPEMNGAGMIKTVGLDKQCVQLTCSELGATRKNLLVR
jgi:hypothetical protein